MGGKYREVGGGPAVGLADNWISMLQSFMGGGSTPAGQMVRTGQNQAMAGTDAGLTNSANGPGGIYNIIQDIISQGGGKLGGNLASQLERQQASDRAGIRAQFSNIGGGYGSNASQAMAKYNAESADQIPLGIANMQMGVIGPLMQMIQQMAGKGVTQRQGVMEQNPILQAITAAAGGAEAAAGLRAPAALPQSYGVPGANDAIAQGLPNLPRIPLPSLSYGIPGANDVILQGLPSLPKIPLPPLPSGGH